jgi:hypothetical protein
MIAATILAFTDDTTVEELAQVAKAAGMHLISNGSKVVVSPVVPAGFFKIAVKVKHRHLAILEALPAAA